MNDEGKQPAEGTEDVEGHARFRPDEDEMFGDDTSGHAVDAPPRRFRPDEDEMFGDDVEGHA